MTMVIRTDYNATLDLLAHDKDNYNVRNHDTACVAYVNHGWEKHNCNVVNENYNLSTK